MEQLIYTPGEIREFIRKARVKAQLSAENSMVETVELQREPTASDSMFQKEVKEIGRDFLRQKCDDMGVNGSLRAEIMSEYPLPEGERSEADYGRHHRFAEAGILYEDALVMSKSSVHGQRLKGRDNQLRLEMAKAYRDEGKQGPLTLKKEKTLVAQVHGQLRALACEGIWAGDLLAQDDQGADWLIEGWWIKRAGGIIAGESKTFKSTAGATEFAVSVATGAPMMGKYKVLQKGPVVLFDGENSLRTIGKRIKRVLLARRLAGDIKVVDGIIRIVFAEDPPILIIPKGKTPMMGTDHGMAAFDEIVGKVKPVLVIMDPLYKMFDGDINMPKDAARLTQWLTEAQTKHDCALCVVHHYNKNDTKSGGNRMMGSVYLYAWLQVGWYFTKQNSNEENPDSTGKPVHLTIEREFRDEESPEKVDMILIMGEDTEGNLSYEVDVDVHRGKAEKKSEQKTQLTNDYRTEVRTYLNTKPETYSAFATPMALDMRKVLPHLARQKLIDTIKAMGTVGELRTISKDKSGNPKLGLLPKDRVQSNV